MKEMPEGWKKLKNSKISFQGEWIPVCKITDEAADLLQEMAEALDKTINAPHYDYDLEARRLTVLALKKFKEWK